MASTKGRSAQQAAIVAAVRAAAGTRFRPLGRRIGVGLDCVGVALLAAQAAGHKAAADGGGPLLADCPTYALSGDNAHRVEPVLVAMGCRPVVAAEPGDVLLVAPTPRQRHLAVVTPLGVVHAHAGIGRVVEGPLDPAWVVLGAWRFPGVG